MPSGVVDVSFLKPLKFNRLGGVIIRLELEIGLVIYWVVSSHCSGGFGSRNEATCPRCSSMSARDL